MIIQILIRYAMPALLVFSLTWLGKGYITDVLDRANGYDQAKEELAITQKKHQVEIDNIKESFEAIKEAAKAAENRREHWRNSYYKVKNEYSEYVKNWGGVAYPDDID